MIFFLGLPVSSFVFCFSTFGGEIQFAFMTVVAQNAMNSEIDSNKGLGSKSEFQKNIHDLADILSKLNPWAKEFVPSSYRPKTDQSPDNNFPDADKNSGFDNFSKNRRPRRNFYNQGKRRLNGKAYRAQREDNIRRTVYVSDIDQQVTEERLAALFSTCGQVVDCRICGEPHSFLHFAFVEFADEHGARAAITLSGTVLGFCPVWILPSKTAILPVNPTFLPRRDDFGNSAYQGESFKDSCEATGSSPDILVNVLS